MGSLQVSSHLMPPLLPVATSTRYHILPGRVTLPHCCLPCLPCRLPCCLPCTLPGIMFFRNRGPTVSFVSSWLNAITAQPDYWDQKAFNELARAGWDPSKKVGGVGWGGTQAARKWEGWAGLGWAGLEWAGSLARKWVGWSKRLHSQHLPCLIGSGRCQCSSAIL